MADSSWGRAILCSAARPAGTERRQFSMCGVSFVNQLDGATGAENRAARTRAIHHSSMMVRLLGAAVRTPGRGRVVSGVGGSTTSSAMAHALPEARSILTLRSTRTRIPPSPRTSSELREHDPSPALRDLVVTSTEPPTCAPERSGCHRRNAETSPDSRFKTPEAGSAGSESCGTTT